MASVGQTNANYPRVAGDNQAVCFELITSMRKGLNGGRTNLIKRTQAMAGPWLEEYNNYFGYLLISAGGIEDVILITNVDSALW